VEDDQGQVEVLEVHTASRPKGDLGWGRSGKEQAAQAAVPPAWCEEREASVEAEDGFDAILKLFDWVN
jgi:hypothetical protein